MSYPVSFEATGELTVDSVLGAVEEAGRCYHDVNEWSRNADENGMTWSGRVDFAARSAAAEVSALRSLVSEVVICSAIRLPDGRVFRGHRHANCIHTAHEVVVWNGGVDQGEHHWTASMCNDQGFITSRNRYVDRKEGMRLQLAAGVESVAPGGYRGKTLFSEDLY